MAYLKNNGFPYKLFRMISIYGITEICARFRVPVFYSYTIKTCLRNLFETHWTALLAVDHLKIPELCRLLGFSAIYAVLRLFHI